MTDDELRVGEARRLEAERHKLELEAREIERRLEARWWQGQKLPQYLLAIVVSAALLFGWTRVYLEPILRKESEINKLAQERNAALNQLLEAQNRQIVAEQARLTDQRDRLEAESRLLKADKIALEGERDRLQAARDALEKRQGELRAVLAGLKLAVDRAASGKGKFFSILNHGDPIHQLDERYGWHMWSDNNYGRLGYYLIIEHPAIGAYRDRKGVIVGRSFEIEQMKVETPADWRQYLDKIGTPVLALDYSYFALLRDESAPVGGLLYRPGAEPIEFYAPLSKWSRELAALLSEK